jgi:hypothetical protein
MDKDKLINEGDYVRYLGNYGVMSGPLREAGVGRIEEFEEFNGMERIYLFLPDRNQHIWCDYERLRSVETKDMHLLASGFEPDLVNERKRYLRGNLIISGGLISLYGIGQHILTGYCVADFTAGINLDNYIQKEVFNIAEFYTDFPSVNNINELFNVLRKRDVMLDWDSIATL